MAKCCVCECNYDGNIVYNTLPCCDDPSNNTCSSGGCETFGSCEAYCQERGSVGGQYGCPSNDYPYPDYWTGWSDCTTDYGNCCGGGNGGGGEPGGGTGRMLKRHGIERAALPGPYRRGGRANSNSKFSGRTQSNPKGKPKK